MSGYKKEEVVEMLKNRPLVPKESMDSLPPGEVDAAFGQIKRPGSLAWDANIEVLARIRDRVKSQRVEVIVDGLRVNRRRIAGPPTGYYADLINARK